MLINNDVTSSQTAHRQRRIAADEKQRVERAASDAAVREGVVRQAGEAPSREEVAQFRALMQTTGRSGQRDAESGSKSPANDAHAMSAGAAASGAAPSFGDGLVGSSMVGRFRALLQTAFSPVDRPRDDVAQGDKPASNDSRPPSRDANAPPAAARQDDGAAGRATTTTAQPRTDASSRQPTPANDKPLPQADSSKPLAATSAGPSDEEHGTEGKRRTGVGEAEAAQALARKAADGETQVVPAARSARGGPGSDDGEGKDAGSPQAGGSSGGVPAAMTDMAAVASPQPQRMAEAAQQAAVASGSVAPALAELVQKHVRQMLVSDPRSSRGRSREVLLRMQNDVLPGTDLWLTQTDNGWQLRADVRSRDAYDTLLANKDELVQRFAASALGELEIEPIYHG